MASIPFQNKSVSLLGLLGVLLALLGGHTASASVTIFNSGRSYPSEPDERLGQQLWRGYDYMGRMQIVKENLDLCPTDRDGKEREKGTITLPEDTLPVALLAKAGGCSLKEKAIFASTKIDPPNLVSYLIVEDEEFQTSIENEKDEGRWWWQTFSDNDDSKINVAILHVKPVVLSALEELIDHESPKTSEAGGIKIVLNSASASSKRENVRKLFMWTSISMAVCCCSCFCFVMCFQQGLISEERQQATQQPQRPVRRRLTVPQVRENFPSFHYDPSSDVETAATSPLLLAEAECSICLDEYVPGVRLRQLPCQHVFHSTCICRWLVERHAVCPLCKIDLYEEEEEEEDSSEEEEEEAAATEPEASPLEPDLSSSWWSSIFASPATDDGEEQPRASWRFRWFSRPTRRNDVADGETLTALTEPLLETPETTATTDATTEETAPPQEESSEEILVREELTSETEEEDSAPEVEPEVASASTEDAGEEAGPSSNAAEV